MKRWMILAILLMLLLSACAPEKTPGELRVQMEEVSLPSGAWYTSEAREWETDYLPRALLPYFFGADVPDYPWILYLGMHPEQPCELLYAVCHTESEARALAETLSARLATLISSGEIPENTVKSSAVVRKGRAVLYTATPINEEILSLYE